MSSGKSILTDTQNLRITSGRLALLLLWWLPLLPPLWDFLFPGGPPLLTDPGIGVNDASRGEIMILALLALAASGARLHFRGRGLSWPGWWGLAFVVQSIISCLVNSEQLEALFFAQNWLAAACVYLAVPHLRPERLTLGVRILWVHLPILVVCLLSLSESTQRVAGPFQLPGGLASWLLMVAPLAFHELFFSARPRVVWAALPPSVLAVVALLMTVSRAAWLVMLFATIGLLLLEGRCSWRRLLGWGVFWVVGLVVLAVIRGVFSGSGLLVGVVILASMPFVIETFLKRIPGRVARRAVGFLALSLLLYSSISSLRPSSPQIVAAQARWQDLAGSDNSAVSRLELWRSGLALGLRHPVWGVGPGRYGEAYPQVQTLYYYYSDSAHNAVCEMAAELGLLGLVFFGLWMFWEWKEIAVRPREHPWQRGLLVGVVSAGVYAQFEVSYHFAYLWIVLAILLASLRGAAPAARFRLWPALGCLALAALPLSVLPAQRAYLRGLRELTTTRAYLETKEVSDSLPAWSAPALSALGFGLSQEAPPKQLQPLAERALTWASETAASYQMAGDLALRLEKYTEAKAQYESALRLDSYNLPGIYHGLLLVAQKTGDRALWENIVERALARYDLSKWRFSHQGHRAQLLTQLGPLLSDIADGLNPYEQPEKTEPLYRFLVEEQPSPRVLHGLGLSLMGLGRTEESRTYLRKAHDLDPVYPSPP